MALLASQIPVQLILAIYLDCDFRTIIALQQTSQPFRNAFLDNATIIFEQVASKTITEDNIVNLRALFLLRNGLLLSVITDYDSLINAAKNKLRTSDRVENYVARLVVDVYHMLTFCDITLTETLHHLYFDLHHEHMEKKSPGNFLGWRYFTGDGILYHPCSPSSPSWEELQVALGHLLQDQMLLTPLGANMDKFVLQRVRSWYTSSDMKRYVNMLSLTPVLGHLILWRCLPEAPQIMPALFEKYFVRGFMTLVKLYVYALGPSDDRPLTEAEADWPSLCRLGFNIWAKERVVQELEMRNSNVGSMGYQDQVFTWRNIAKQEEAWQQQNIADYCLE